MAPLPKQKVTKARGRKRRSHRALTKENLVPCPQCNEKKLSHTACPNCGTYQGQEIIKVKAAKQK